MNTMRSCISWMFWVIKNYDSFSNAACKPAGPPPNIGRLFVRVDVFFHLSFWSVIIIASVCVKSVVSGIIFLEPFPLFDPIKFFTYPINKLFACRHIFSIIKFIPSLSHLHNTISNFLRVQTT
jgi:hypothetical protein